MWRTVFFINLIALSQNVLAVSLINFKADVIEHDKAGPQSATLHNINIALDLQANTTALLNAEQIEYKVIEARNVALQLDYRAKPFAQLTAKVRQKEVGQKDSTQKNDQFWLQTSLSCQLPKKVMEETWQCTEGKLAAEGINLPFSLNFTPSTSGLSADLSLNSGSFSDVAGLHAGEKLKANFKFKVVKDGKNLRWSNTLDWLGGEVFWQPFYLKDGGHQFTSSGVLEENSVNVEQAELTINNVGKLNLSGQIQLKEYAIAKLDINFPEVDLATAYPLLFKPLLEKTALGNVEIAGHAGLQMAIRNNAVTTFNLKLNNVDIEDENKKFAFYKMNASIPWSYDDVKNVNLTYASGQLLNLPLGNTKIQAEVNRYSLVASRIDLPILDGALQLSDISAARVGSKWSWHLTSKLTPISMEALSQALKLPLLQGKASAEIPLVTYNNGMLTTDGEIVLNVFDGKAAVSNLTMQDPLSSTPKLSANMTMRNLDLGSVTRTFSFGGIEGKLDVDVENLQMQNWKPVWFDATVKSSPGKYPKKISQRAVENISALGGAGAAAAVQRSVLRFFKDFNYEKIGLSCKLRNDICQMGGVESTPGGYVIVKGSGIPAITILGYNQTVGWAELLSRVKRVTDSNTKVIIK